VALEKLLQQAEVHAQVLGLPKIVMTVISMRTELIDWYKRHGYIDTGDREPFPVSDIHISIVEQPLGLLC
jgi:ribosomal protein S18 acetylase RimI-like enzyme